MRSAQVVATIGHGLKHSVALDLLALGDVILNSLVPSLLNKLVEALLRVHALARLVEVVIEAEVRILKWLNDCALVATDRSRIRHACLKVEDMVSLVGSLVLRQNIFAQLAGIE